MLIYQSLEAGNISDIKRGITGTFTPGNSKGFVKSGLGMGGLEFDGANSTLVTDLTDNSVFQNGFSIEAWVYARSSGETGRIVDKTGGTGVAGGFTYYIGAGNRNFLILINGGGSVVSAADSLVYNKWIHVVATFTAGALVTHYVNGVVSGTPAVSNALSTITTANPLTIGNNASGTARTFDGLIQNVKIFNHVLTQSEINNDFAEFQRAKREGTISRVVIKSLPSDPEQIYSKNLLAGWNMKNVNGKVVDISGNGKIGTISGARDCKGLFGRALNFDGVDDYIDVGNINQSVKSIELLFKPKDITAHTDYLIDLNGTDYLTVVNGTITKNGFAGASIAIYANGSVGSTLSTIDKWYHIILTSDIEFTASDFDIGRLEGIGFAQGIIDEVRLHSSTLSATQVLNEYKKISRIVLLHEDFSDEGASGITKLPRGWKYGTATVNIGQLTADNGTVRRGAKYMNFVSAGTIKIAVDLSDIPNNGYISYDYMPVGTGVFVKRAGLVNAPVTGVAYSDKVLTFTGASIGDRIANIVVRFGAPV